MIGITFCVVIDPLSCVTDLTAIASAALNGFLAVVFDGATFDACVGANLLIGARILADAHIAIYVTGFVGGALLRLETLHAFLFETYRRGGLAIEGALTITLAGVAGTAVMKLSGTGIVMTTLAAITLVIIATKDVFEALIVVANLVVFAMVVVGALDAEVLIGITILIVAFAALRIVTGIGGASTFQSFTGIIADTFIVDAGLIDAAVTRDGAFDTHVFDAVRSGFVTE